MSANLKFTNFAWTGERIDQLIKLWNEGHTTAEIGRRMSASKNAIIGKAHRLGLPSRPSPIKQLEPGAVPKVRGPRRKPALDGRDFSTRGKGAIKGPTLPQLVSAPRPVVAPKPALVVPYIGRVGECTFIVSGERRNAIYCDKPTVPGKAMCLCHWKLCFKPMPPRPVVSGASTVHNVNNTGAA